MMNIVQSGSQFMVYGEDVKTYKILPAGTYEVGCSKFTGFFLTSRTDLKIGEEKVYGNHEYRALKVLNSFDAMDRNLGIILSGQKGIGKSLFARVLSEKALNRGLSVIVVAHYFPGIADFISSIEQNVVIIFDEFEKTFKKVEDRDPQEEMLSLFDGIDGGKKIFVVTCNEVRSLNSYLLNRPGRFHYHFNIGNPGAEEVTQYLTDKLMPEYHENISRIVRLSGTMNITYDYLRAITFELNQGYSLEEALGDLNITRGDLVRFDIVLHMVDGSTYVAYNEDVDLFNHNDQGFWARNTQTSRREFFYVNTGGFVNENGLVTISGAHIHTSIDEDDFYEISDKAERERAMVEAKNKLAVKYASLERCPTHSMDRYIV